MENMDALLLFMGLSWVSHKNPSIFFMAWQYALPENCYDVVWIMAFYAIIWSIWLIRNDMVFNGKVFDLRQTIDVIKLRIASWFNAKWPGVYLVSDVVRFSNAIKVPPKVKIVKEPTCWKFPTPRYMKFNVDGSFKGKPRPAGIGGVLRDCSGAFKAVFSKAIGLADSNVAELLAVREA